jgi:HSP20 family protein
MNLMEAPRARMASADEERISTIARQMSRWVDQVLGKGFHGEAGVWTPAVNFYEGEKYYCLVVELAGVDPDKIDLRVENGVLTVCGERTTPGLPEDHRAVRLLMMEIDHGNFSRSVKLPSDADDNAVSATYRGGYLWIRLPKKP